MRIGIYVGSFNPVHKGHIKIINHLLDNNYLDKILVIPTGNYWNKNNLLSIEHRINMLKFYENENIIIDTKHNDLDYTYQVMDNLYHEYKNDKLYLIIGADNIINFSKWKNYKKLLKYNFIIVNRDNININEYLNKLGKYDRYFIVDDLDIIDISSTKVRNCFKSKNLVDIGEFIDNKIFDYIKDNNLLNGYFD